MVALVAALQPFVDPKLLFMDIIAASQEAGSCCRGYFGTMSQLGGLGWAVGAGAAALGALSLWSEGRDVSRWGLLGLGAILSAILCADDMLMLHESIFPGWGVPQVLVLGVYALAVGAYALAHGRRLLHSECRFLALALVLFGSSLGIDLFLHSTDSRIVSAEDGLKFVAIYAWAAFHISVAHRAIRAERSVQAA